MTPIEEAAEIYVRDLWEQRQRPVSEAARLAYQAGGPSLAELERHITARRSAAAARA